MTSIVAGIAGQRLVDRVVHHFVDQMMQAARADVADVHRGPAAGPLQVLSGR